MGRKPPVPKTATAFGKEAQGIKTYFFCYECVGCPKAVMRDIRVDVRDEASLAYDVLPTLLCPSCPWCKKPLDYDGCYPADADGYRAR